jgi:hypothetical protein
MKNAKRSRATVSDPSIEVRPAKKRKQRDLGDGKVVSKSQVKLERGQAPQKIQGKGQGKGKVSAKAKVEIMGQMNEDVGPVLELLNGTESPLGIAGENQIFALPHKQTLCALLFQCGFGLFAQILTLLD